MNNARSFISTLSSVGYIDLPGKLPIQHIDYSIEFSPTTQLLFKFKSLGDGQNIVNDSGKVPGKPSRKISNRILFRVRVPMKFNYFPFSLALQIPRSLRRKFSFPRGMAKKNPSKLISLPQRRAILVHFNDTQFVMFSSLLAIFPLTQGIFSHFFRGFTLSSTRMFFVRL